MIVTKTPLRVSFFGGGSDIPEFYNNNTGVVLSTTINKPIYIAANLTSTKHVKVSYSEIEVVPKAYLLKHDRVREILDYFGLDNHIEISSFSEIPTKGTGLGSSSSFTVGLIKAITEVLGVQLNRYELAELACMIEIDKCGEPIGKQDQYAAVFGGLNVMYFEKNNTAVIPLNVNSDNLSQLRDNLLFFNTGVTRKASSVLSTQVRDLKEKRNVTNTAALVTMAEAATKMLLDGKIDDFGSLLHDGWSMKKKLSTNVSTPEIDEMYQTAIDNGALGGKILGAGGGGYLMMYARAKNHQAIINALSKYDVCDFDFTDKGCTVEMNDE